MVHQVWILEVSFKWLSFLGSFCRIWTKFVQQWTSINCNQFSHCIFLHLEKYWHSETIHISWTHHHVDKVWILWSFGRILQSLISFFYVKKMLYFTYFIVQLNTRGRYNLNIGKYFVKLFYDNFVLKPRGIGAVNNKGREQSPFSDNHLLVNQLRV